MAKKLNPELYQMAQVVFGDNVPNNDEAVSWHIQQAAGPEALEPGFMASAWLREQAARRPRRPVVFEDLTDEPEEGPSPEEIEAAEADVRQAREVLKTASPAMRELAGQLLEAAETRLQELVGKEEAELETVTAGEGGMHFEPLTEGPVPLNRNVSGPVVLTKNALRILANGPAWTPDAGKSYAVCDDDCATAHGPAFLRVYGTNSPNGVKFALSSGPIKFTHMQPQQGKQPAGATIFSGYNEDEVKPSVVHVLDITTDGGGAWFVIRGKQKVGGGSLGGSKTTHRKGGSLDPR